MEQADLTNCKHGKPAAHAQPDALASAFEETLATQDRLSASEVPPAAEPLGAVCTVAPKMGSERLVAVNTAAASVANVVKIAVQLVMLPLMAHLLGPTEFGIYALALPAVVFFMMLADGGLGTSLAREREQMTLIWSSAFWLLIGLGALLTIIVAVWGIVLAQISGEQSLRWVMGTLSVSFLLVTVSVLPSARLTQQGRLAVFAVADICSTLAGAVTALILAMLGVGALSLAVQYVVVALMRAIILNAVAFVKPRREFQWAALKDHLAVGSSLLGSRSSEFLGRLVENLAYGHLFAAAALGIFSFANQASRFLCEALAAPIWAALYAQALRECPERVTALHIKMTRLLAMLVFPGAFLLSAAAPEVLGVVLGPSWAEASVLLRILVPFYALSAVAIPSGAVLLARGEGWPLFKLTLALTISRVAAVCAGVWVSQVVVTTLIAASQGLFAILMLQAPYRRSPENLALLARNLAAPLAASLGGWLICYTALRTGPQGAAGTYLALLCGAAAYLGSMLLLDRTMLWRDAKTFIGLVRR